MILRMLGPVDLRAPDGRVLRAVLGQSKRLALLTYLAAARPVGFHSRDTLLGLLWPEFDQEHARAALRQALYVLRRALGPDVIVGCGDSVLGVDPSKLWCDVNAFEEATAAGDHARALELYRGEALRGFHVAGAPEFERWVDRTRARLSASAAASAWRLVDAEEESGNSARALDWMRVLLAICPDDERALRRTLSLLCQVGNRAEAIRVYEEFSRRIQEDYGLGPSSQTLALMATVRTAAPVATPTPPADRPSDHSRTA
jgi:DNA-binding SARP family transcriptional activator